MLPRPRTPRREQNQAHVVADQREPPHVCVCGVRYWPAQRWMHEHHQVTATEPAPVMRPRSAGKTTEGASVTKPPASVSNAQVGVSNAARQAAWRKRHPEKHSAAQRQHRQRMTGKS